MENQEFIFALDNNTEETLTLARQFTAAQLQSKKEGGWTVIENLEHILITDKVVGILLQRIPSGTSETLEIFGQPKLQRIIVDLRARKVQAPEFLQPKGKINDVATFEEIFIAQRNELKDNLVAGKITIDNSTHKHPYLGEMTMRDWFHFIPLHTIRHMEQIREILTVSQV